MSGKRRGYQITMNVNVSGDMYNHIAAMSKQFNTSKADYIRFLIYRDMKPMEVPPAIQHEEVICPIHCSEQYTETTQ